jgi:hypothetical protein
VETPDGCCSISWNSFIVFGIEAYVMIPGNSSLILWRIDEAQHSMLSGLVIAPQC